MIDQGGATLTADWCLECCTRHEPGNASCADGIITTGPEVQAWRGVFQTPHGGEAHVVQVAPVGERWQARILTEPCIVWTIPGHPRPMKFLAGTSGGAVDQAIDFIRHHCEVLGHPSIEQLPSHVVVGVSAPAPRRYERRPQSRKRCEMAVLWGFDRPVEGVDTENVSENGMFLITDSPADPGVTVKLRLSVDGCTMPVAARVVWSRKVPEPGLPAGMGVSLMRPPAIYSRFVQRLG